MDARGQACMMQQLFAHCRSHLRLAGSPLPATPVWTYRGNAR